MKNLFLLSNRGYRRPMRPGATPARHRGVTMIELLVALVIFSFGMLGLAGLQMKTMAYSQSSLLRSQAMALTDDVLDRMRADRTRAKLTAGGWNSGEGDTTSENTDLADWKSEVAALLPSGTASITVTETAVTVTINWVDSPDKEVTDTFTTVTRL